MASIKDVAAEAKVSQATVSKVLNNRDLTQISQATRERVQTVARRLGYHPSAIARGLAGKRMNAISILMAYDQTSITGDPYLGPCLDGILAVNKRERQKTILFQEDDWNTALSHLPSYLDGTSDGLLLVIPRLESPLVEELARRNVPFVLVGDSRPDPRLVCVDVDNTTGACLAMEHLLQLGHRRIAAFLGNPDFCSNSQRLAAYRSMLEDAGIPFDPQLLFPGEYHPEHGASNARAFLERFPPGARPTAVFCFCDAVAVGALPAFVGAGVRIPEELSLIGFDDIGAAASLSPSLTTIRQSVRMVGQRAAESLLGRIRGEVGHGERVLIRPELVVRGTTAPPPGV